MSAENLAPILPKLGRFIRLLASDQPGEVAAAASALCRTLATEGCDVHDLARHIEIGPRVVQQIIYRDRPTEPEHDSWSEAEDRANRVAAALLRPEVKLTVWERDFVTSIVEQLRDGSLLSDKQKAVLKQIVAKRLRP